MNAWIAPTNRSNAFQIAFGAHKIEAGKSPISATRMPPAKMLPKSRSDSQFETRMYTKSVTANGNTNGAIRIPIADSIWLRIWMVIASKNNCTPPGTPVEVTLARKKNASAMTMTAEGAADATVASLRAGAQHYAVL